MFSKCNAFDFHLLNKLKNSLRRGLFHPDDIKTIGLAPVRSGPMSAPLPGLSRKSSRPSISPRGTLGSSSGSGVVTPVSGHHRSNSFANGSLGKTDFQKQQAEFGKYAEDDEEDYEDVFGKPNASCEYANLFDISFGLSWCCPIRLCCFVALITCGLYRKTPS